jgi:putative transposase
MKKTFIISYDLADGTSLNYEDLLEAIKTYGRKFRTFNVMDDCSREVLAIEVDTSLSSRRIIRTLERIIESRGKPKAIRTDNGPEFTSHDFEHWCRDNAILHQFIQPGKPMQNGYIERFNRLYREAILDAYLFFELDQVRQLTTEWMEEYNYRRPHEALDNLTPKEWKNNLLKHENTLKNTV